MPSPLSLSADLVAPLRAQCARNTDDHRHRCEYDGQNDVFLYEHDRLSCLAPARDRILRLPFGQNHFITKSEGIQRISEKRLYWIIEKVIDGHVELI